MRTNTYTTNSTGGQVILTLPDGMVADLKRVAAFNNISLYDLIYSYIAEGLEGDSLAINRLKFTDSANKVLEKNNMPPKSFEDIFDTLLF